MGVKFSIDSEDITVSSLVDVPDMMIDNKLDFNLYIDKI